MPQVGTVEVSTGGGSKVATGTYVLRLKSCVDVGKSTMYPDSGNQWKWIWTVMKPTEADPDEAQLASVNEEIHEWTADWIGFTKNGEKSKALARIDALAKVDTPKPGDGEEVDPPVDDTDELVGQLIKSMVDVQPNKDGNLRAKLLTVAKYDPKPGSRRRATAPPPPADDEDDDEIPF
jgi:hypothetical protein